jgi:transcriptional regulator with XRE-family HTH domain
MANEIFVSDSKRRNLPRIFRQLGIKQFEVAKAVGISPASISRFTAIGADRINLRPEKLQKLVNVLKEQLAKCRTLKNLSFAELEEKRKTDRNAVEAAGAMTRDSIKELEIDIAELLMGDSDSDNASSPMLVTPGGALAVQAKNYVPRKADREIEEILRDVRSPSSVVLGPIHGGTSSFLERVYQRARDTRGCWACIVHFEAAFVKGETFTQLDLFRFLFGEMGVPDDLLAGDSLDVHDMKDAFDAWAETAWRDAARVVIVVDGLDEIFKNAGALVDPLAVANWFQSLRNRAASGTAPYNKLALFVALTGATWSAAHGSPYATNAGALDLIKFSQQEVVEVFKQLQVDIDGDGIARVYELFRGHPYLTQLFAWSMRDGSSSEAAVEMSLNLAGRYEAHWERMKSEIEFLIGKNYSVRKVLGVVAKIVTQQRNEPLGEIEEEIWRSYRRGLRMFGLIDGPFAAPSICEFYRTAIEREE